jgi:arylsulfatase
VWAEPFTPLRVPKLFNLRTDPYERADITSNTYYDWLIRHDYILFAAQVIAKQFADTFVAYPPRQKAASFTIDDALLKLTDAASGKLH